MATRTQSRPLRRGAMHSEGALYDFLWNVKELVNTALNSNLSLEPASSAPSVSTLTKGAGVSAAESYAVGVGKSGTLITTSIVVDLTGLVGSATDTDIIGNTGGAASAHWGQITTAVNGTIIGGKVTCLEVPAGGTADIDFYSANESTGAQDGAVTSLTETALVTSGGSWTSGTSKGMTTVPPANDYLYITNGAASGGTFTAGKFLIQLFGYAA